MAHEYPLRPAYRDRIAWLAEMRCSLWELEQRNGYCAHGNGKPEYQSAGGEHANAAQLPVNRSPRVSEGRASG